MAFASAQKSRLLVGSYAMSGTAREFGADASSEMLDVTTLETAAKVFIPGQDTSKSSIGLLFDSDTTAGLQWSTITTWKGTPQVVSFGPEGWTAGSVALLVTSDLESMTFETRHDQPVAVDIATQAQFRTDVGVSNVDITTSTASGNTSFPTAGVDNGAASTGGAVVHLHVLAYSGYTDLTFKLRSSTDDSTYADVSGGTFTTVTGTTSERLVIASGTTINRYTKIQFTPTGTGSVTFAASLARR